MFSLTLLKISLTKCHFLTFQLKFWHRYHYCRLNVSVSLNLACTFKELKSFTFKKQDMLMF